MVFSSVIFLFYFLPLTLLGYYLIRKELRNVFLLAASLFFYAWGEPKFVFVMLLVILISYLSGLALHAVDACRTECSHCRLGGGAHNNTICKSPSHAIISFLL